jgi:hypothetical protein
MMKIARRYVLTRYDAERQLALVAAPSTLPRVQIPLLGAADPVPDTARRTDQGTGGTGDPQVRGGFAGSLRVRGEVAWRCGHGHRTKRGALVCAWQARGLVR